jgi:hypothetical protein
MLFPDFKMKDFSNMSNSFYIKIVLKPVPTKETPKQESIPKKATPKKSSGYSEYFNMRRIEISVSDPELGFGEVTKQIHDEWNALSDAEKKPYYDQAHMENQSEIQKPIQPAKKGIPVEKKLEQALQHLRKDVLETPSKHNEKRLFKGSEEYAQLFHQLNAEMDEYQGNPQVPIPIKVVEKEQTHTMAKPLRSMGPYIAFQSVRREQLNITNPELDFGIVSRQISTEWINMSSWQKIPYEKMAAIDKTRYKAQKELYLIGRR